MHNAKRNSLSWLGSLVVHGAALGTMSFAVALVPVEISFQRGQNSVELQATMAAAPQAEPEPTPIEIEQIEKTAATKPIELSALDINIERDSGKPPLPKKPAATEPESREAEPDEVALAKQEVDPVEKEPKTGVPPPPKRKQTEAKIELPDAPVISAATAASRAESGEESDREPSPHFNPKPRWPAEALARRWQGRVLLRLEIASDGTVDDVQVMQSSGFDILDLAAVEAVRDWRFTPARRGGTSVAVTRSLPIHFRL